MLRYKEVLKSLSGIWAVLLLAGFLAACGTTTAALEEELANGNGEGYESYAGKKIVWVNSYHEGYEWSDGIGAGIEEVLADTDVDLKVILLDTKRNGG